MYSQYVLVIFITMLILQPFCLCLQFIKADKNIYWMKSALLLARGGGRILALYMNQENKGHILSAGC